MYCVFCVISVLHRGPLFWNRGCRCLIIKDMSLREVDGLARRTGSSLQSPYKSHSRHLRAVGREPSCDEVGLSRTEPFTSKTSPAVLYPTLRLLASNVRVRSQPRQLHIRCTELDLQQMDMRVSRGFMTTSELQMYKLATISVSLEQICLSGEIC